MHSADYHTDARWLSVCPHVSSVCHTSHWRIVWKRLNISSNFIRLLIDPPFSCFLSKRYGNTEILIGTCTWKRFTQRCNFEWLWATVARFSTTLSVARLLCDSWAYCKFLFLYCVKNDVIHHRHVCLWRFAQWSDLLNIIRILVVWLTRC